ncbi:threonine aspartase 1 isoform X2 [Nilaparvata lugens]|nr:threonine aspartase 1 isoform X2 [Nilaparvata lugens]
MNDGSSLDAVAAVTEILENSALTNAGYGSNLTWDGRVECDASVMDGSNLQFGACAAVSKVKNPVLLAQTLCKKQLEPLSLGRMQPCLLVGSGASEWASNNGLPLVDEDCLISERALKQHNLYKKRIEKYNIKLSQGNVRMDTVGSICMDKSGHIAASSSSGGIVLKPPGRVGQAAIFGGGCWAEDGHRENGIPGVAVSTSGCGEHIIKTFLAKEAARSLQTSNCPTAAIYKTINDCFLKSPFLQDVKDKLCGVIALQDRMEGAGVEFLWAHTTQSICVGYMSTNHSKPQTRISRLASGRTPGSSIVVEGVYC